MTSNEPMNKKTVFAWSMYDFANSSFTTLVVTFVYSVFFAKTMAADEIQGTALWTQGVSITAIVVALLSPIMGALADRGGYRKAFMLLFTVVCIVGTVMLYFQLPYEETVGRGIAPHTMHALLWFVIANIAFEMGCVFYNAFLPDIAPPSKIGRISGYGWALGYMGGLLCLFAAFVGLVFPETPLFGISKDAGQHIRSTNLLVAGWFALFSIPTFLILKEDKSAVSPPGTNLIRASFSQLRRTFSEIQRFRQVVRLLIAKMVYNDGLVTIFAMGGVYAAVAFGFSFEKVLVFGLVTNISAGIGAYFFGFIDDRLGGKKTIAITIVGLFASTLIATIAPTESIHLLGLSLPGEVFLWLAGLMIGIFSGPNQAASRSLLGRFAPPEKENEFYGFFAFSGKATAFVGPLLFGLLTTQFQSARAGISVILLLFLVGGILLLWVDEEEGIARAGRTEFSVEESV